MFRCLAIVSVMVREILLFESPSQIVVHIQNPVEYPTMVKVTEFLSKIV